MAERERGGKQYYKSRKSTVGKHVTSADPPATPILKFGGVEGLPKGFCFQVSDVSPPHEAIRKTQK